MSDTNIERLIKFVVFAIIGFGIYKWDEIHIELDKAAKTRCEALEKRVVNLEKSTGEK